MRQHAAQPAAFAQLDMHALVGDHVAAQSEILRALENKRQRPLALVVSLAVDGLDPQQICQIAQQLILVC